MKTVHSGTGIVASFVSKAASVLLMCSLAIIARGCPQEHAPNIDTASYADEVLNPFLPFVPGSPLFCGATTQEMTTVSLKSTKAILDMRRILCDAMILNGNFVEDTLDRYPQEDGRNVWSFGEDAR